MLNKLRNVKLNSLNLGLLTTKQGTYGLDLPYPNRLLCSDLVPGPPRHVSGFDERKGGPGHDPDWTSGEIGDGVRRGPVPGRT